MQKKSADELFSQDVLKQIRKTIRDYDGNEVFFAGLIDSSGLVISVMDAAHGNEHSVPVQLEEGRNCAVLIHNHPGGNLTPSDADIAVAQNASQNAQGFYIIDNDVQNVYVVVEPVKIREIQKLDEDDAAFYLSNGGPLSKISENYEERKVQIELLRNITKVFNNNGIGVFEAGTGVGKSFAYLIPSILWAEKNAERVVISTGTINLQSQICEKDIPMAEKILGKKIKYILLKGRNNYICKRRFFEVNNQRDLFDDGEMLDKLADWVETSPTGSRSDLSFMPPDQLWTKICSESDACMGMKCPFHSECFVMKVRKEASNANIIVVNHHLLFADIDARLHSGSWEEAMVLPPYKHVVFDEAHGIESSASSFFSSTFNRFKIIRPLNTLYRKRKNSESGYMCTLALLSNSEESGVDFSQLASAIRSDLVNLETAALDLLSNESTLRLYQGSYRAFGPVISLAKTLSKSIDAFVSLSREIMEGLDDRDKDIPVYWEANLFLRRLEDACSVLNDFSMWDEKRDTVFWIQKKMLSAEAQKDSDNPYYVVFTGTPLEIADLMNKGVYEPLKSVVCTSATLKTGKNFSFWMQRNGLFFAEKERIKTGDFPSPFPYEKNTLFAVPKDAPFPDDMQYQGWVESAVTKLILASEGRSLVLFTSYESLRQTCRAVERNLSGSDIMLLKQGQDDNSRLLEKFRKDIKSCLFATDSFWQGVDVPGSSLSQVIIVKLPFSVPNDPVFAARSQALQEKGLSPFMELSIPEAIVKFRQGFGRLMRRSSDRGAVVVLDRRLYEKKYGAFFIQSIPECKRIYAPLEEICDQVSSMVF